jgi:8-oxo-dGTP diphosphatase
MSDRTEVHFCGKIAQKAIIEREGKILLLRDTRLEKVVWEIPGGRMNEGEEPRVAIAREVYEELGLRIDVGEVVHLEQFLQSTEGKNAFVIVYSARLVDEAQEIVMDDSEVCEVGWFEPATALTLPLFPEYKRALELYTASRNL